jgi:hypothetical protein
MAKSYEELELEQKNETEFVLSKTEQDGTKREFLLSETDVVLLGRVVPSIVRQINAGKSPGFGILARPAAPMTEALSPDSRRLGGGVGLFIRTIRGS